MHRFRPSLVLAALWAWISVHHARRVVRAGLPQPGAMRRPPRLPADARQAVVGVLRRMQPTCLVEALVLQAWDAAHGNRRDIVIGVTGTRDFQAHAWLDGDPASGSQTFAELVRVTPPAERRRR